MEGLIAIQQCPGSRISHPFRSQNLKPCSNLVEFRMWDRIFPNTGRPGSEANRFALGATGVLGEQISSTQSFVQYVCSLRISTDMECGVRLSLLRSTNSCLLDAYRNDSGTTTNDARIF